MWLETDEVTNLVDCQTIDYKWICFCESIQKPIEVTGHKFHFKNLELSLELQACFEIEKKQHIYNNTISQSYFTFCRSWFLNPSKW